VEYKSGLDCSESGVLAGHTALSARLLLYVRRLNLTTA